MVRVAQPAFRHGLAGLNAKYESGATLVDHMVSCGYPAAIVQQLIALGARSCFIGPWSPLLTLLPLIQRGSPSEVKQQLSLCSSSDELRALVNAADAFGQTALHYAVWRGDTDVIAVVVAAGADPNARATACHSPHVESCGETYAVKPPGLAMVRYEV